MSDPLRNESRLKRLHDLRGVYADFKLLLRLIRDGYRFDDKDAPAVIQQLERNLEVLKNEIQLLKSDAHPD